MGRINKTKGTQVEVLAHFYLGTTLHCFGRCIYIERTIYSIIKTDLFFWIISSKDRIIISLWCTIYLSNVFRRKGKQMGDFDAACWHGCKWL